MTVMRQPVSPTVMMPTEPPPSLSAAQSLLVGILYISLVLFSRSAMMVWYASSIVLRSYSSPLPWG